MTTILTAPTAPQALDWAATNERYLALHVERLRLRLERRIAWLRSRWHHSPIHEAASQVISDAHADWLLQGEDLETAASFDATDAAASELGRLMQACEQQMAALVRAMGWQQPALEVLAHLFGLSPFERDVLVLTWAPDHDPALRAVYAYVQDDMTRQWPTPQLALSLAPPGERAGLRERLGETATLRRYALVRLHGEESASPMARLLGMDERIIDYIQGINRPDERLAPFIRPVEAGPLTAGQRQLLVQLAAAVDAEPPGSWPLVNLVGQPDSGQREIAAGLGASLKLSVYRFDVGRLRAEAALPVRLVERESILLNVAWLIELEDGRALDPAVQQWLADLAGSGRVLVMVSSREPVSGMRTPLLVRLARPDPLSNLALWQQTLGEHAAAVAPVLPLLVEQFDFGAQAIRQVAAHAQQAAQLAGEPFGPRHLWDASRDARASELDGLAQRLAPAYTWDDLVVSPQVLGQLRDMAAQAGQRYKVYEEWGFSAHVSRGRGISALFSGPSGTGKTMAAEVLANHLGLALYRIDVASLLNKYVGETEKNIRQVFEAAERCGALLFFDEADALFGKRTEGRDSHDRFANIEINYLLQRMESYWGVVILATNRRAALDRAFLRRLRFVIDFAFPDADARRRLWLKAFPPATPLDRLDFQRLARLEVSGGSIRSIALNAAFLAATEGKPVTMRQLMTAAHWEYLKVDKMETEAEFGEYLGRV